MGLRMVRATVLSALLSAAGGLVAGDWRGDFGLEYRWFLRGRNVFPSSTTAMPR